MMRFLGVAGLLLASLALPEVAVASGARQEAHAFIYHRFGDSRYPSTNIPLDQFEAQLRHLKATGSTVLPLGEVVRHLLAGIPLPPRTVTLTVDDAYTTFLDGAMPLLRRYGFPVTLFVSTDSVGRAGYLSWEQLRGLVAEGVEIGNHGASHVYLLDRRRGETSVAWQQRIKDDILRCQQALQRKLGIAPQLFAYPFGEYSRELQQIVREFGFVAAAGQQSGIIGEYADHFALPRFPMGGSYATVAEMKSKLALHPLPVRMIEPLETLLGDDNPPELVFEIVGDGIDVRQLRCFVNGQPTGIVRPDGQRPGRFRVRAAAPLAGRRDKYTLSAPGLQRGEWYWFTRLWVRPAVR